MLDVLVAEQQLFTTQAQLVTAEHDSAIGEFNVAAPRPAASSPPNCACPSASTTWGRHYRAVKDKWIGFAGGLSE